MATIVERLRSAHEAIAKLNEYDVPVPAAWSDADFAAVEEAAGVKVPALMRELYTHPGATPWFGVSVDEYPGFEWASTSEELVERQVRAKELAKGGDLPDDFLCVSMDEDYLAILDDGRLVQVCNNEANIEDEEPMGVTTYEAFIDRYLELIEAHVADAG